MTKSEILFEKYMTCEILKFILFQFLKNIHFGNSLSFHAKLKKYEKKKLVSENVGST